MLISCHFQILLAISELQLTLLYVLYVLYVKSVVALKWQVGFENDMKLTPIFTINFSSKMLIKSASHHWNRVSKGRDVPRDVPGQTGTGRPVVPLSRDKKVSLSRRPFVPGQKSFACPAVPLSRDKGRSKCPGTNSSVPGRPGTK